MNEAIQTNGAKRRVTIRYEGHVQGVGFRYTTIRIAQDFEISGYVQNDEGGSVTLVAEGGEHVLQSFLQAVRSSVLGRYIRREHANWSAGTGEYQGFTIGYGG